MKDTQKIRILRHLKRYGQITAVVAFNHYHVMRLASRIWELKKDGHNIESVRVITCRGQYVRYVLIEPSGDFEANG